MKPINSSITPHEEYLSILISIFSFETTKERLALFKDLLEKINSKAEDLASMGIPVLVGFYVMHAETFPLFANEVWQFLLKKAEKDVKMSHLIIFNLLTCKHTYKKHIEYTTLKSLICEIMNQFDYDIKQMNSDTSSLLNKDIKNYHSLFYSFESFEDFVDKNLLRLDNAKKYVSNGNIQMNQILSNLRKANNDSNPKWEQYCSSLNLINDVIAISELLCKCPIKDRNRILHEFILIINKQCLPSKIYDPFGENKHSHYSILWRISEDYSYPISTKERVPCHLLFEFSTKESIAQTEGSKSIKKPAFTQCSEENSERPSIIIPRLYKGKSLLEYMGFSPSNSNETTNPGDDSTKSAKTSSNNLLNTFFGCFSGSRKDTEANDEEPDNSAPETIGIFGNKKFKDIQEEILSNSKYRKIKNRYIASMFIKGNEDLRQDYFVSQIAKLFNNIFLSSSIDLHIQPLEVISNGNGGLIKTIVNSTNLMKINKLTFPYEYQETISQSTSSSSESAEVNSIGNLRNYFIYKYGRNTEEYNSALNNFISSLAGSSLLCYFLEVKDRNNANILIDDNGNLIHIDYGFLLSKSPGNMQFEKAPFKFTSDFVNLLQGTQSQYFLSFQELFEKGYRALREKSNLIIAYIYIFSELFSDLPIFTERDTLISGLKEKFCFEKETNDEILSHCNALIFTSINNWRTKAYDQFQKYCVGIN